MAELIDDNEVAALSFTKKRATVSPHYVNNKELSAIMVEWRKACDEAKAAGEIRPRIPEYVGVSILQIAQSLAKRHNFRGYSWIDEMVSDAVLHVCKYIHNFNPFAVTISGVPSAFSYINRIIWRSFTHRIQTEERNQYLKNKSFELLGGLEAFKDEEATSSGAGGAEEAYESMNYGNGASMSIIGEELLRRAYEYEAKYGLGPKAKKGLAATEVEDPFLLSLMEGAEIVPDAVIDEPLDFEEEE